MYKINENDNKNISKTIQNNEFINTNTNTNIKLINDDINKLTVLPKYCPLYPKNYSNFFNDNKKLNPVEPYKYKIEVNPNGGLQTKMDYNIFYSNMKLEALQSPQSLKQFPEYQNISGNTKYSHIPNILYNKYNSNNTFSKHLDNQNTNINSKTKGYKDFDKYNEFNNYNDLALQNVKNLYSSVFEDMYIMGYNSEENDDITKNINYYINHSGKLK